MSQKQGRTEQSPLALHRKIAADIRQEIMRKSLAAHSRLASEIDLAERYGVSRGTVTKALDALVQQGIVYRRRPLGTFVAALPHPSPSAVSDADVPPTAVGLVIPFPPDLFVGSIILGVETVTRAAGVGLIFAYSDNDEALERYHVGQFLRSRAAGILIFPADTAVQWHGERLQSVTGQSRLAMLAGLQRQGVPFVLIDRLVPELSCDYVVSDDTAAGYAATQHLVALGHRRVGFLSIFPQVASTAHRYAGYLQCLHDHGLPAEERLVRHALRETSPSTIRGTATTSSAGHADRLLVREFLTQPDRPTAVIAANDYVGLRLLQCAEDTGLDVPGDLAIVCCGGSDLGAHARVPLTTIMQPAADVGRQAAQILLDHITGRASVTRQVTLPVSLVVRRSCGAASRETPLVVTRDSA